MSKPTLLTPYGYSSSTCGYCGPSGERSTGRGSKKYGREYSMSTPQMTVEYYQKLIDRGWRRSGTYVYQYLLSSTAEGGVAENSPDMARTCCPQYTIRLNAAEFKTGKKHRQVMNRWNRFLKSGHLSGEGTGVVDGGKGKGKAKAVEGKDWTDTLQEFEIGYGSPGKHRYTLVPAKATKETYGLYKRYQTAVHKDKPEDVSMKGFRRFLCDSPLINSPIAYSHVPQGRIPKTYGSYHLLYRVDGSLVGISVIDILPACVSSVYFIWDPDWAWASLGKLSALREIALVREMREAGAEGMGYLYMGYWIPNCQKMRYKSEYSPSYLLDPVFHLLDHKLDVFLQDHPRGYFPFADIHTLPPGQEMDIPVDEVPTNQNGEDEDDEEEEDDEEDEWPNPPPPGMLDPGSMSQEVVDQTLVLLGQRLLKVEDLEFGQPRVVHAMIRELVAAVGEDMVANALHPEGVAEAGILHFG